MTKHVIETITFRLVDTVEKPAFLKAAEASTAYIRTCPGFIARRLSCGENGDWVEHIEWASMDAAKSAAAGLGQAPEIAPFLTAIHMNSVVMRHTEVELAMD